jgi:AcrR family transcriptional regulator
MRSRRQELLEATAELVERSGVLSVTLEAVAGRAGVSKGGLLHHFPNKSALVGGMVEWIVDRYYQQIENQVSEEASARGNITPAYVATSARVGAGTRLWTAVLTACLLQPSLLDRLRERANPLWNRAIAGPSDVDAAVAWLAADGLWLAEMLGLYNVDDAIREAVVARLDELSQATSIVAAPHSSQG